jgi:hypothetical protein
MKIGWLASSVVVFTLAIPTLAAPGPIYGPLEFRSGPDDGDGKFDATGASGYDGLQAPDGVFADRESFYLEICHGIFDCESLGLSLTWTVGPRISFEPASNPDAPEGTGIYTYGAGTLTLDGHWNSHDEPGIFVADITSLVIELTHECSFGLCGTTRATLGDGLFHKSLARIFRVSTITHGGSYGIDTDGAYFFGDHGYGLGDNYGPGLEIDSVEPVPEPASILVTALGLLGVAARRRRARVSGPRAN